LALELAVLRQARKSSSLRRRPSVAQKVVFTIDAAGRHLSQTIGSGSTTSYEYLGTSDQISSECTGGVATYSAIDAIGDRLSQGTAGSVSGYLIADLHGNIVAAVSPGSSPLYLSAYRYDPYGETVGLWSASSGFTVPWRFQGRMLESDIGSGTDLYDFGARSYDPSLGAFTSFDSVSGSAQNPLTLNRYLYASANPATLVDPDGHKATSSEPDQVCVGWDYEGTGRTCIKWGTTAAAAASSAAAMAAPAKAAAALAAWKAMMAAVGATYAAAQLAAIAAEIATIPTTYLGETDAAKLNIYNENLQEHYSGLCSTGDKSACATASTIHVDIDPCPLCNAAGWVQQHPAETLVAGEAGACLVGFCLPLAGMLIYAGTTVTLNRLTGQPLGTNLSAKDFAVAGTTAVFAGPIGGLESYAVKLVAGGAVGAGGDLVSQSAHHTHNISEFICSTLTGAYQSGLPELEQPLKTASDILFSALGFGCSN
jgi:RHS repeat-associated protein